MKNILLVKETKAGEKRVALLPEDITSLLHQDVNVYVESGAGLGVDLPDSDYEKAGAVIRPSNMETLFQDIDIIIRAKRPDEKREIEELKNIKLETILIGSLDPREKNSKHMELYQLAKIQAYSIDYLSVDSGDPLNLLEKMSELTGKLALEDAVSKSKNKINKVVIVGFGAAGKSAYRRAVELGFSISVFCTRENDLMAIEEQGHKAYILEKNIVQIENNRKNILDEMIDAQIVITSARSSSGAPILITSSMLRRVNNIFIVDLAISDGGNVEGSHHDKDIDMGNNVIVSNISGYPKIKPLLASQLWSESSRLFVENLLLDNEKISSARVS